MGKIRRQADFSIHEATNVPLHFLDETGSIFEESFSIQYRSYSRRGGERLTAELEAAGAINEGIVHYSPLFEKVIVSIIDQDGHPVTDDSGAPAKLTQSYFDGMLPNDLEAIQLAINGDENPPSPSPTPGPSGSSPVASEG